MYPYIYVHIYTLRFPGTPQQLPRRYLTPSLKPSRELGAGGHIWGAGSVAPPRHCEEIHLIYGFGFLVEGFGFRVSG